MNATAATTTTTAGGRGEKRNYAQRIGAGNYS